MTSKTRIKLNNKVVVVCMECGHKFKRTLGKHTYEVRCPKCHGHDCEVED